MSAAPGIEIVTTGRLQWLRVTARFRPLPRTNADAPLVLVRRWTGGYADQLILRAEADVEAVRTTQGHPTWRDRDTLGNIIASLQELGAPTPTSSLLCVK